MKKFLSILAFFLILEYQVFFGKETYALLPALGLFLLSLYELLTEDKYFFFREQKLSDYHGVVLNSGEKLTAAVYAVIIFLSIILGAEWAVQLTFILLAGVLSVTFISILEWRKGKNNHTNNWMSTFTIPKIFLFVLNYLLSIQIHQSMAYQSILLLSCFVLYDIFAYSEQITEKARKGAITEHEFRHYLFHRWSKYWNLFLGVWLFIALRANGVIGAEYEYILLFAFMVIFMAFIMKNETDFTLRDFGVVVVTSGLLAGISPLLNFISGNEIPTYLLASAVFVAFDLGDSYFHQREFRESTAKYWSQKGLVYLLMAVYIIQLHLMMTNNLFAIGQVAVSIFQ